MPSDLRPTKRRLIACCDGTWNSPDRYGHTTNVVRLVRSIRSCTAEGISQVTYYQPGVGTGNVLDHLVGGGTGIGLSENVRSAYAFFVDNYQDGDEIFLFGFSRGAYTARSVAGLMAHVGMLRKHHMENFDEVWDYYRQTEAVRNREEATFLAHFPDRVPRDQLTIRCVGVWDTVGSLGIPNSRFCSRTYRFHDTTLGPGVEYAFQALAIDEHRKPFAPSVWKANPAPRVQQVVEQAWFAGVHSDVGGGYPEHVTSDAPLFWMASRLMQPHPNGEPLVDLDPEYLCAQADRRHPYGTGMLHKSLTWWWKATTGSIDRTICETDPSSEWIHQSVYWRAEGKSGVSSYGTRKFRKILDCKKERMAPLSEYESMLLAMMERVRPEKILSKSLRRLSFCDKLIGLLGGYRA